MFEGEDDWFLEAVVPHAWARDLYSLNGLRCAVKVDRSRSESDIARVWDERFVALQAAAERGASAFSLGSVAIFCEAARDRHLPTLHLLAAHDVVVALDVFAHHCSHLMKEAIDTNLLQLALKENNATAVQYFVSGPFGRRDYTILGQVLNDCNADVMLFLLNQPIGLQTVPARNKAKYRLGKKTWLCSTRHTGGRYQCRV